MLLAALETSSGFLSPCTFKSVDSMRIERRDLTRRLPSPAISCSPSLREPLGLRLGMAAEVESTRITQSTFPFDDRQVFYVKVEPPESLRKPDFPPIIFLHGLGSHSVHFSKNMKEVSMQTGACVYGLDFLGLGRSSKPVLILACLEPC